MELKESGKSTFAAQFPNPLFIDTEGSTAQLDVKRLPEPTSWAMIKEEVQYVDAHFDVRRASHRYIGLG